MFPVRIKKRTYAIIIGYEETNKIQCSYESNRNNVHIQITLTRKLY